MKSRIVLPPLDEQKKIAEILSTQDKAIELQERKIEELKRFKRAVWKRCSRGRGKRFRKRGSPALRAIGNSVRQKNCLYQLRIKVIQNFLFCQQHKTVE